MSRRLAAAVALLTLIGGCERGRSPAADFERMWHQRRANMYDASALFADGKIMRPAPDGTVARSAMPREALATAAAATVLPIAVTRATLERGRDRFEIYCAACHGRSGDGVSPVAEFMTLRAPPTLLGERVRRYAPGQIFTVISSGYGLMPSYAQALSVEDRWAVIAYLRVLQLRDRVPLDALPSDLRRRALDALSARTAPAPGASG
jgi:mono/diheme cytochrome c family protein